MEEKKLIDNIAKHCCKCCEMSWGCDDGDCAEKGMEGYKRCGIAQEAAKAIYNELKAEATKSYNNGFDKGVKAAVEKMRAYLPPRDVDDYPDAIPSHWQLDEVLRQLIGNK